MVCPDCHEIGLSVEETLCVKPSWMWDEILVQIIACARCRFRGVAVYAESRRGALDDEAVDHHGYRLPAPLLDVIERRIAACPSKRDESCTCIAHEHLGRTNAGGHWCGLDDAALRDRFVIAYREVALDP
jgi:hypothetical protein